MASFKSAIAFGLVYVPIALHTCIKDNEISFNQLYKKTGERIKYKKTCENCPAIISSEDIVKGYQYTKDRYVILTDKDFDAVKSKKDKSIEIKEFVKLSEIDPIFFDKSYYIQPTGAENAFKLILKALEKENKVGIAKTVLGTKEQIVAIRVINGQMLLYTLHFYDEIQVSPVKEIKDSVSESELKMAVTIIDNMTNKFEPENYKNEYRQKVMAAIEQKIKGKQIEGEKTEVRASNIISLLDALKRTVENTKKKPDKTTAKLLTKTSKETKPASKIKKEAQ